MSNHLYNQSRVIKLISAQGPDFWPCLRLVGLEKTFGCLIFHAAKAFSVQRSLLFRCFQPQFYKTVVATHFLTHFKRRLSDSCPTVDRRTTIYSWTSVRYTRTSNPNRWSPGHMFSSIKYEHFVQVSSNQKHVFIIFATVWSGEHFKATVVYFACSHARVSQSAEIRSACCNRVADCLVTLHFIGCGF